jgi:hypothetical protein
LTYILEKQSGGLNDLISEYGEDKVEELCLTGFIHQGRDGNRENTWKITDFASKYIRPMQKKPSLANKISGCVFRFVFGV